MWNLWNVLWDLLFDPFGPGLVLFAAGLVIPLIQFLLGLLGDALYDSILRIELVRKTTTSH